jgi:putative IMPACT (imprinted ancient) family translation regulator
VLVVVIRYFGGTKLGVSGLINAYKTATKDAIEKNIIIEKFIQEKYQIHFPHEAMNQVMRILKRDSVEILNHEFQDSNIITFQVRKSEADEIISQLKKIDNLSVKF